ncbi:MAG: uncharacterized protein QG635_1592 [Bacteroidota bacterium]|nr:uncharacterized protein [Bacteroidota bacterium]
MQELEPNVLGMEELEALRLADFECMKQEDSARLMNISRATFGRIIEKARHTVADALLNGKAIIIQGGNFCNSFLSGDIENIDLMEYFKEKRERCQNCPKYKGRKEFLKSVEQINN